MPRRTPNTKDSRNPGQVMMRGVRVLLWLLLLWGVAECRTRCHLTEISIVVESEECNSCISINTTACAGLCQTQERAYRSPMVPYFQNTCNYLEWTYETVTLPSCPPGADSTYTYPVALSCECSQCNTDSTDCGAFSMQPGSCHAHVYYYPRTST